MPKGPKGEKRPADVISNAVRIARIATGEEDEISYEGAAARGQSGGLKGGKSRAARLSAEQKHEIARSAANARWKKKDT